MSAQNIYDLYKENQDLKKLIEKYHKILKLRDKYIKELEAAAGEKQETKDANNKNNELILLIEETSKNILNFTHFFYLFSVIFSISAIAFANFVLNLTHKE